MVFGKVLDLFPLKILDICIIYENVYFSFQKKKKTIAKECIRNPEALHFKSWAIFSLFLLEAEKQM